MTKERQMLKEHQDDKKNILMKKHQDVSCSSQSTKCHPELVSGSFFSTQIYLITKSFGATVNKLRTASLMRFAIYELFIVYK